ncbi:MAG: hypothetical protein RL756_2336 [Pseudomonadota bacterium]|jgi:hypothetical protein
MAHFRFIVIAGMVLNNELKSGVCHADRMFQLR